jgi:hypothetical protein
MKNDAELPKTNPRNKIKNFYLLIAATSLLAGLVWVWTQGLPWLGKNQSHLLPLSEPLETPWRAFYTEQSIGGEESFDEWAQRTQRSQPGDWNFWLSQLQGLDPKEAYPLLKSPHVDSLVLDVTKFWGSDLPEIKSAKTTLFEVISRYRSLQQFTDSTFLTNQYNVRKPLTIIGMVGLFHYQTALTDSTLWLGLDMFMNEDYRYYPSVENLYQYQRRRTAPRYMPVSVARTLAEDWVLENLNVASKREATLLDQILREGQTLACMRWLLPEIHDTLLLGYSGAQWKWIKNNQGQVWRDLVSQDLLFSGDPAILSRYLHDGPFSSGYPQQSPPALGLFIGDAVVQKWIQGNRETGADQPWTLLLKNRDLPSTQILKKSGYKGR